MASNDVKLYSLSLRESRTYLLTLVFILGNIVFPQLCHLIPMGGKVLLPIYLFTLVGSYKFGLRVGLLTAIMSPVANHLFFGMPPASALTSILVKSVTIAVVASVAARKTQTVSITMLALVVLAYQVIGCVVECFLCNSFIAGVQDFRIGIPGMLIQVFGGYLIIKHWK